MNGPQHYRKAEGLLKNAWKRVSEEPDSPYLHSEFIRSLLVSQAQVHATLALVAATAEQRDHTPQQEWGGTSTLLESQTEWDGAINQ